MIDPIGYTEDILVAECARVLKGRVRQVISVPGGMDTDQLRRISAFAPAVFVTFQGGPAKGSFDQFRLTGRFDIGVVVKYQGNEQASRRGDAREIGGYQILAVLGAALHGFVVEEMGTVTIDSIGNGHGEASVDAGATVYGLTAQVPLIFDQPTIDGLAAFKTFHADYALKGGEDAPVTEDTVTLP